jgi:hypothetical protein
MRHSASCAVPYQQLFMLRQLFRTVGRSSVESPLFEEFAALFPFLIEVRWAPSAAVPSTTPPTHPLLYVCLFIGSVCCAQHAFACVVCFHAKCVACL